MAKRLARVATDQHSPEDHGIRRFGAAVLY